MFAAMHGSGPLLDCAGDFSPRIEIAAVDTVVLDIRGLDRLFGTPRRLAEVITGRARETGMARGGGRRRGSTSKVAQCAPAAWQGGDAAVVPSVVIVTGRRMTSGWCSR